MALGSSPYSKIKTRHFKQAKNTKTRYRTPFFALPFGFLFILLTTIAVLKNLHPKYSSYRLDQKTCLSQLNLNFLSANTLCEHLANQLDFSDFKIQDSQTYNLPINTNSYLVAKIELPVVDFYSPLQNITADQLSDSTFLSENQIQLVSPDQLNTSTKLLSYENQYYLDTQQSGARFTLLHITSTDSSPTTDNTKIQAIHDLLSPLFSKNQPKEIVSFAETGVTALTRRLTYKLNQENNGGFFAEYIADFLKSKTFTHISNEISFKEGCQGGYQTMTLCADWRSLDTITAIGTDIVELTGNHNNDTGSDNNLKTLAKYRELGLKTVGGGANLEQAKQPLDLNSSIRLLAYNHSTSSVANGQLATANSPGANPYSEEQFKADLASAKAENKFTIVNIQFFECYAYPDQPVAFPTCDRPIQNQKEFFRHLIDLGADLVVGTSAHQPQTYELYQNKPIYYGLGNLFFDQIYWPDTTRSLILTHYFDQNKLLQTRISPTIYDQTFRPCLLDSNEAQTFLARLIFASPKGN